MLQFVTLGVYQIEVHLSYEIRANLVPRIFKTIVERVVAVARQPVGKYSPFFRYHLFHPSRKNSNNNNNNTNNDNDNNNKNKNKNNNNSSLFAWEEELTYPVILLSELEHWNCWKKTRKGKRKKW